MERFSRWAPTYDRHRLQRLVFEPVQKTVLELAEREVPAPRKILDVGCGTGRLLQAAAERFPGASLEGVDAAEGMVEQARGTNISQRTNFQVGTAENLPFPDSQFDLVFCTMTFHHWANQARGAAEIARVLAPAGRWILADPIVAGPLRHLRRLFHLKFAERKELEGVLATRSLEIIDETRVHRRISILVIAPA